MEKEKTTKEVVISMPNVEALGELKNYEVGYNLQPAYRTQEEWAKLENENVRAFFMGMREIPNEEGEAITCAIFATEKEVFLSAQMVLVDAVKNLPQQTPVQITYKGKKKNKTSQGATNIFEVIRLKQA